MQKLHCRIRKQYNENCIRTLKALALDVSTYGRSLIPTLRDKLQDDLVLVIARRLGSEIWKLNRLIVYIF